MRFTGNHYPGPGDIGWDRFYPDEADDTGLDPDADDLIPDPDGDEDL